jgi:hypothetical protein
MDNQYEINFTLFQEDSWDGSEIKEELKKEEKRGEHEIHDR